MMANIPENVPLFCVLHSTVGVHEAGIPIFQLRFSETKCTVLSVGLNLLSINPQLKEYMSRFFVDGVFSGRDSTALCFSS